MKCNKHLKLVFLSIMLELTVVQEKYTKWNQVLSSSSSVVLNRQSSACNVQIYFCVQKCSLRVHLYCVFCVTNFGILSICLLSTLMMQNVLRLDSQGLWNMFVGIVVLRYQHHTKVTTPTNFHISQSPLTND